MQKYCYLCEVEIRRKKNRSDDHVPPRGFFPDHPLTPENLFTVPCCIECNSKFKLDDEAVRDYLCAAHGASPEGEWVFENKVKPRFTTDPVFCRVMAKSTQPAWRMTEGGLLVPGRKMSFDVLRMRRFLVRIAKVSAPV